MQLTQIKHIWKVTFLFIRTLQFKSKSSHRARVQLEACPVPGAHRSPAWKALFELKL